MKIGRAIHVLEQCIHKIESQPLPITAETDLERSTVGAMKCVVDVLRRLKGRAPDLVRSIMQERSREPDTDYDCRRIGKPTEENIHS